MKTLKFLSILSIIVMLSSCSVDYTDLDNLVGTRWKATENLPIDGLQWVALNFTTRSNVQILNKYTEDAEEYVQNTATYSIDGSEITIEDEDGNELIGKISNNKMTFPDDDLTFTLD